MVSSDGYDPSMFSGYLQVYYKRIFPYKQYFKWLTYGKDPVLCFQNREFCFTLANDVYVRFLSFKGQEDMEETIKKKCPHKIDLGAIYTYKPADRKKVDVFTPLSKELVFDIDMTDYDEIRTCCSGANICNKCWKFMTIAVKILDSALREDYGYKHLLWVYSGRRGIHCWVCDAGARTLNKAGRSALSEYLLLVRGGMDTVKKVNLPPKLHPSIKRALEVANNYFEEILEEQDLLGTPEGWKKFLSLIPDKGLQETLEGEMKQCRNSLQRWSLIESEINKAIKKGNNKKILRKNLVAEIILQHTYPRLDINVTKGLNHLLKSPFSIHPKTGRVCVCFNPQHADKFDPMAVPLISEVLEEINAYDKDKSEKDGIEEYKKTSLKGPLSLFDAFLAKLDKENKQHAQQRDYILEF